MIEFVDRTYGAQCEALATECGDFLVRRSDGVFPYQLAVVVDDAAMGVTEVVRGCDLLGSTPRQIYLQHLLELPTPHYARIPLLMSPDGRRLSKRDRDLDLGELRTRFGAPEALLGWLAGQTGIAPDATPRSAEQLVERFRWDVIRTRIGKTSAVTVGSQPPRPYATSQGWSWSPSGQYSRRARCGTRLGWRHDENARSTSACSPGGPPARRKTW